MHYYLCEMMVITGWISTVINKWSINDQWNRKVNLKIVTVSLVKPNWRLDFPISCYKEWVLVLLQVSYTLSNDMPSVIQ